MTAVSFITANFVARQSGYQIDGWGAGEAAVRAWFSPEPTFAGRFGEMLDEIAALGFDTIDLWTGHLDFSWATDRQAAQARDAVAARGMRFNTYAGWFGADRAQLERSCELASILGIAVLGGGTSLLARDLDGLLDALERHDLRFGLENHPEPAPRDVLDKIGDHERLGATVDTGWFGTQGYDAARAIIELGPRILHVHLKDVRHAGMPHETCAYGEGVVPLRACVEALEQIGYGGAIAVEHEPEDRDPRDAIRRGAEQLRAWLA